MRRLTVGDWREREEIDPQQSVEFEVDGEAIRVEFNREGTAVEITGLGFRGIEVRPLAANHIEVRNGR